MKMKHFRACIILASMALCVVSAKLAFAERSPPAEIRLQKVHNNPPTRILSFALASSEFIVKRHGADECLYRIRNVELTFNFDTKQVLLKMNRSGCNQWTTPSTNDYPVTVVARTSAGSPIFREIFGGFHAHPTDNNISYFPPPRGLGLEWANRDLIENVTLILPDMPFSN
jgi:hypothetical protein